MQQVDDNGYEYIGKSIANGFFGFVGKSHIKSPFLYRAMELFAEQVRTELPDIEFYAYKDYQMHILCNCPFFLLIVRIYWQFDNRKWDTGGSRVLTKTLREYCNISEDDKEQITGN